MLFGVAFHGSTIILPIVAEGLFPAKSELGMFSLLYKLSVNRLAISCCVQNIAVKSDCSLRRMSKNFP